MRTKALITMLLVGGSSVAAAQPRTWDSDRYPYGDRSYDGRSYDGRYYDGRYYGDRYYGDPTYGDRYERDAYRRRDFYDARFDARRFRYGDRIIQIAEPWQMNLGRDGHAAVRLDPRFGRFRMLRLESDGRPVYIDTVVLHFGNGRTRQVQVNQRLSQYDRNVVIDLPGQQARRLRAIEVYGQARGRGSVGIVGLR